LTPAPAGPPCALRGRWGSTYARATGTPLGDFIRAKRDITRLADLGLPDLTRRLDQHVIPQRGDPRLHHPSGRELRLVRETLELSADAQQLVVLLPADEVTAQTVDDLRRPAHGGLRAIS